MIDREEILVGKPGAVVQGGIVIRADGVKLRNITVIGGENGIEVERARRVVLDHVRVLGARLDGIHVRFSQVMIHDCSVALTGPYSQGIDISYSGFQGMSAVEGCDVSGGSEGIVTHSSMVMVSGNRVHGTSLRGITMSEMSMGDVTENNVSGAPGAGASPGGPPKAKTRGKTSPTPTPTTRGRPPRAGTATGRTTNPAPTPWTTFSVGNPTPTAPPAGGGARKAEPGRIEDYALIGDLQTAALVSRDGLDRLVLLPALRLRAPASPRCSGTPSTAAGCSRPATPVRRSSRRYRHDTLILESVFETDEGTVRAIDFMPPRGEAPDIVRIVEGLDGNVPMRSELVIRFDYGKIVPWVRRVDDARVAIAGPDALCFRTPVEVRGEDMTTVSEFTLAAGRADPVRPHLVPVASGRCRRRSTPSRRSPTPRTTGSTGPPACSHQGDYHDEIHQSLLVLKALTYAPTGGIVAAPTTSLPEWIGGVRNWDYRFCWLRDATLTLLAMLNAGYRDEAEAWRQWLLRAVAGDPGRPPDHVRPRRRAAARRARARLAARLRGLEARCASATPPPTSSSSTSTARSSTPLYQTRVHGAPADDNVWSLMRKLLEWLEDGWRQEDAGIWEVRGPNRHFTHSKVMAWVAFDRAVRFHEEFGREGPVERWRALRDEIHAEVLERAWNRRSRRSRSPTAPTSSTRASC